MASAESVRLTAEGSRSAKVLRPQIPINMLRALYTKCASAMKYGKFYTTPDLNHHAILASLGPSSILGVTGRIVSLRVLDGENVDRWSTPRLQVQGPCMSYRELALPCAVHYLFAVHKFLALCPRPHL